MSSPKILWQPPPHLTGKTPMDQYRAHINAKFSLCLPTTQALYAWTVTDPQAFWLDLYSYLDLIPALPPGTTRAYDETLPMSSIPPFFEGLQLNYAENVLRNAEVLKSEALALIGVREGKEGAMEPVEEERVTWGELRNRVGRVGAALKRRGVRKGDVIAALVSTSVEAVILFLATAAVGGVFTSISPDLGAEGCVSRLRQVIPKILFADAEATYKGRRSSQIPKIRNILSQLDRKPDVIVIPILGSTTETISDFRSISDFLMTDGEKTELTFERVPFNYPLVICYSSGTTGAPKCIVHQHGLILQFMKVSRLHNSLTPTDTVMQYSSTSWILFYVMNGHLATGATTICYDGSPMWPDVKMLLRILHKYRVTYFGTSPRYLLELERAKVNPKNEFDLTPLRMVNTTGATLSPDQYQWFYTHFPGRVHLSNSAGGTDSATSIIASDPAGPLRLGEMQIPALGIDVDVAHPETGESIKETGLPGEMVVRKPFPSMPAYFWGDKDGTIYKAAYFERFDNIDVWAQHDWISFNPATNGWTMHGRSDGVLNPSGIRFGSGEIYAIVEGPEFNSEIAETLCVGRRRPNDTDESVFLFVRMVPGHAFTHALMRRIRDSIGKGLSQRHIPKFVLEVEEIPVTINGKKVETAVKQLISGKAIQISSTVANPGCLKSFAQFFDFEGQRMSKL